MAEVIVYARANCPHCHMIITRLTRALMELGLPPPLVHYVSPLEEPPLPPVAIGIDLEQGGKILGPVLTEPLRGSVPVTYIRLFFHPANVVNIVVYGSVRREEDVENLCKNIALLIKLYLRR